MLTTTNHLLVLSTETTNPSSLQDDFQTSEPKAKQLKSTKSTQPNFIPTFPPTQGLLLVVDLTYECDIGLWQELTEEMRDWCRKGRSDCHNETASNVNAIQIDGKQKKIFLQVHVLLFSAEWREEEEKLALVFPKYRLSIFLPM